MARRKTDQDLVRSKLAIAARLVALRSEIHGERGGPEMARRLNIPVRTWYNYEKGITVPAEIILKVIKLTGVDAAWLLDGSGPMFADPTPKSAVREESATAPDQVIGTLLRTALHLLENSERVRPNPAATYAIPESTYGSANAIGVATTLEPQSTAHDGPWSDKTMTMRGDMDRPGRRRQA
jgi:hypothetical protein